MINRTYLLISLILNSFKYSGSGQNSCVDNLNFQMSLTQPAPIPQSFSTSLQTLKGRCLLCRISTFFEPVTFRRLFITISAFCKVQDTRPRVIKYNYCCFYYQFNVPFSKLNLMLTNNLRIHFLTNNFSLTETASASISSPHHCTLKNFSFTYTSILSYWVKMMLPIQEISNIQNNSTAFSTISSTFSNHCEHFLSKSGKKKKNFPASLELQGSLPCSQETINGRYPHSVEFSLHTHSNHLLMIGYADISHIPHT